MDTRLCNQVNFFWKERGKYSVDQEHHFTELGYLEILYLDLQHHIESVDRLYIVSLGEKGTPLATQAVRFSQRSHSLLKVVICSWIPLVLMPRCLLLESECNLIILN